MVLMQSMMLNAIFGSGMEGVRSFAKTNVTAADFWMLLVYTYAAACWRFSMNSAFALPCQHPPIGLLAHKAFHLRPQLRQ
jgi:hypothetical protein